ncbi:MAG: hypothetical protein KDK78_11240 [Chlamydiia bacterium]|nr:hypothetical protein [Chlamydiia bacterium]
MHCYPETVVFRHKRERLSKCSLRGLEPREDFTFFRYPITEVPECTGYILLDLGAPPLTRADAGRGLLVLDATWRWAEQMHKTIEPRVDVVKRSIPAGARTAYPRRQDDCADPEAGLASIEAIYIAYVILGRSTEGLLDGYYWGQRFLELNTDYLRGLSGEGNEDRC